MIQSMTGYGKSSLVCDNRKITVEIRSLNSKQLDILTRIPHRYSSIEPQIRSMITENIGRGKVDITITCDMTGAAPTSLNIELLKSYKSQIEELNKALGLAEPADWHATLLRLPDALKTDTDDEPGDNEISTVVHAAKMAIDALMEFRTQEGAKLRNFFASAIERIGALLKEVPKHEQARIEKIRARILDSLGGGMRQKPLRARTYFLHRETRYNRGEDAACRSSRILHAHDGQRRATR